jgi:hypothetical protein
VALRWIPTLAAVVASARDLLMLWVANARRPELALGEPAAGWLALGGALGVLAIPLYAIGWRDAARIAAPGASPAAARALAAFGGASALLGAAIHALTALEIDAALGSDAPARDPLAAVAATGGTLVGLWAAAAACVLVASAIFARAAAWAGAGRLALATPVPLTLALVALAVPWVLGRAFLAPAAPNLAHVIFFAACARRVRGAPP